MNDPKPASRVGAPTGPRSRAVDLLKGAGILGVILIHAARSPWDPGAVPTEVWMARLAHYAVPGFLAASGYLHASEQRITWPTTRRRLLRLLVPYLVASGCAQLYWAGIGEGRVLTDALYEVALAASFGPYYYVFQIVTLVLLAPLLPRLPRASIALLAALFVLAQLFVNSLGLPLFWALRVPLFSAGSFLLGWSLRVHGPRVEQLLGTHGARIRSALFGGAAACAMGMLADLPEFPSRVLEWAYVNLVILGLFSLPSELPSEGRLPGHALRMLSESSYAIFLFHLFFMYAAAMIRPLEAGHFDAVGMALHYAAGLGGGLVLVAVARWLLGGRARSWLGA